MAMAAGYGTTTEQMQRAAQQVVAVNEQVQSQLAALRNQLAPLAGAWRGEASTAFQGLMARWDSDARTLNEALRGIGEAIQGSGRGYQQAEDQQHQSLSAIQGALG
jgi:WXG100 family type VII secretion target